MLRPPVRALALAAVIIGTIGRGTGMAETRLPFVECTEVTIEPHLSPVATLCPPITP